MPFLPIPVPLFPFVPLLPGVPPILRQVGNVISFAAAVITDGLGIFSAFAPPQWGLFDQGGAPVIVSDSIREVEFRRSKRISTAPQTQGAFVSYNKVSEPFQGRVVFMQGGSDGDRNIFLNEVESALRTLELFDLVMPDIVYPSVNVIHHDFRRTAHKGLTLLAVEVWIEEVRVTGTSQFTQTASPDGAATKDTGSPQPVSDPGTGAIKSDASNPKTYGANTPSKWPTGAPANTGSFV